LSLTNASVDAIADTFVKRTADGSVNAKNVVASGNVSANGHIIATGAASELKGFVIRGGTF
jgi:hypothetical protein